MEAKIKVQDAKIKEQDVEIKRLVAARSEAMACLSREYPVNCIIIMWYNIDLIIATLLQNHAIVLQTRRTRNESRRLLRVSKIKISK